VLAEKLSGREDGQISGHSTCHRVVNFKGNSDILGTIREVRITEAKSNTLLGEPA